MVPESNLTFNKIKSLLLYIYIYIYIYICKVKVYRNKPR